MAEFVLGPGAADDIRNIYSYGSEMFGRAQADAYIDDLYNRFTLLATFPGMGIAIENKEMFALPPAVSSVSVWFFNNCAGRGLNFIR